MSEEGPALRFAYTEDPKLAYLEDPTLYLGRLPRDIRQYCIEPLLRCLNQQCPEEWATPQLRMTRNFPFSTDDFIVLANGDLFLANRWNRPLGRWNPRTEEVIYTVQLSLYNLILYDYLSDTLILYAAYGEKKLVPLISTIRTRIAFEAALREYTSLDEPILFAAQAQLIYPNRRHQIYQAFPTGFTYPIAYYGQHLILLDRYTAQFHFYRI